MASAVNELAAEAEPSRERVLEVVERLLTALEAGRVRAAEPDGDGWRVQPWVKQGILLAFRHGVNRETEVPPAFHFRDRDT
ncbi:MAG: 2,3,4,5-tetrahydropyridine-2,6-dicarboxylate N-succinyltransferase, partial [Actinobacteria bacterium]|nr:2,3,4,5-tetrahydropyridine-2,6-dicarboxylate N-succinyltransferase [Actinomycetota bacterium]NIS32605.1 2,3,4,5-tetrahydropyridine-2,6-dicarboxylate N-succinyltransferase [Actinomycetota bacterium]NIT96353.1 2,3,4,5-tetrahydropyridine-2,6-dicarboxylate N-succinyltransferase [Actinomycetota bacterium]NIU67611.1 2,3,4,5-tetrahydropyridine-2,6-dicarboxylate N-succinyltransferase [Actinomycetota bacterium]NIV56516.1 2,3,4,5-tetrahydropyridine-2,6-dicarboxylate N-succinyltransferase [Actinomyceto